MISHQKEVEAVRVRNEYARRAITTDWKESNAKVVEEKYGKEKRLVLRVDALRAQIQAQKEGLTRLRAKTMIYRQKHTDPPLASQGEDPNITIYRKSMITCK